MIFLQIPLAAVGAAAPNQGGQGWAIIAPGGKARAPAIDPAVDEALLDFIPKKKDSMPDAFA
jgi:hypothetical protein